MGVCLLFVTSGLAEAQAGASWTVTTGEVEARCRLTIGGGFDAVTSGISGSLGPSDTEPEAYRGALTVDLTGFETGIDLRDNHLRDNYLEVDRGEGFAAAVLSEIRLAEPWSAGDDEHETDFTGTLLLHGVERAVEGEATLARSGSGVEVEAAFAISLEAFEVPPPRYLGVGVRDEVRISVSFEADGGGE